jgi:hypothetical protein
MFVGWSWNGEFTTTVSVLEVIIVALSLLGLFQHRMARDASMQDLGAAQAVARNRPNILLQIRMAQGHIRSENYRIAGKIGLLVYGLWTMMLPNRDLFPLLTGPLIPQGAIIAVLILLNLETWQARHDRKEMLLDALRAEHISAAAAALPPPGEEHGEASAHSG